MTEIDGLQMGMIGSALGFAGMLETVGASITPAAGNALSTFGLNAPFLLWAGSGLMATLLLLSYQKYKTKKASGESPS